MASKFVDSTSIIQVIGCVFNNPSLLEKEDMYLITEDDFVEDFHKVVYGSIYKVYELGAKTINLQNITDFLATRPKSEGIFKANKGGEWLLKASEMALQESFDYYYNRLKKMTLLRAFDTYGIKVDWIYDPDNILDPKKKEKQEEFLDNTSLDGLAELVNERIDSIKEKYVENMDQEASQAGEGALELIERLKESPEIGLPMYGPLINTVTRGARLGKYYLRSAATGIGKSRSMIADVCFLGASKIYDDCFGWIKSGAPQPVLYITTEQDKEEIQTMMLAFLSNVNEEHILNGRYEGDEEKRVMEAANLLLESSIYIEELPDFSLTDVENVIKKNIRENQVSYIFFDYIQSSLKILEEISKRTGGAKFLREDNVLFMLSARLKDICNNYGVFILTATQLNANYTDSDTPDQNLLRGAKSIADRADLGMILLGTKAKDIEALETILATGTFSTPNLKISIYKNRRGRYKGIYLWAKADLGTCRIIPMFATDYSYELIPMDDLKIIAERKGAF